MSYTVTAEDVKGLQLNETDTVKSVLQNVAIILGTWQGTVPLYRHFGISSDFLHLPIPAAKALLVAEVKEKVERFEPRAEVVRVAFSESTNGLIPFVEVNIIE